MVDDEIQNWAGRAGWLAGWLAGWPHWFIGTDCGPVKLGTSAMLLLAAASFFYNKNIY